MREPVHSNTLRSLLEEIVLVGTGVLLVFLGVFSSVLLTSLMAVAIGVFLFYIAAQSYRVKFGFPSTQQAETEEEGKPIREEWSEEPLEEEQRQVIPLMKSVPKAHPPVTTVETKKVSVQDSKQESASEVMSQTEPQSEFNNLLTKALQIVKEVCFAHSVIFFWVKQETRQLVIEGKVTDSDSLTQERKLPLGLDIVSAIGMRGESQYINNILPETERDVLCYYKSLQNIRSFAGVPVYYAGDASTQPIGVLIADSKAEDSYGEETLVMLTHVSALISSLLISYTEKYDLFSDVKLIESDVKLKSKIAQHPPIAGVINALTEELEHIVEWESISVVLYDDAQRAWAVASARVRGNDRFVSPKQVIDFNNSIVGHSIQSNSVQSVNLAANTKTIFHEHERSSDVLKQGMLVVAPVSSGGKCYGAVVVTDRKPNTYSKKDIAAIQYLSSTIAPEFEITELNAILSEHLAVDELTGTLSRKFFGIRLNEELSRATDREEDLSLVMISLHNVAEILQRYENEGKDAAVIHIARHLRSSIRPYDSVARFDGSTFAVILTDTIANDAFLWAEKLRTAIAGSIVTVGKKSFSITVTIGISGATAKMTSDELIKNVSHVLDLAKKAGGNIVRVF